MFFKWKHYSGQFNNFIRIMAKEFKFEFNRFGTMTKQCAYLLMI